MRMTNDIMQNMKFYVNAIRLSRRVRFISQRDELSRSSLEFIYSSELIRGASDPLNGKWMHARIEGTSVLY